MKILMIGLGGIGQRHLRNLYTLSGENLEVIAYRTRRLSTTLTDRLQIDPGVDLESKYHVRTYTDLALALAEHPEVAFICNPSSLHIPVALKAAEAGCHLFIEKPISNDLEGIQELATVLKRKSLVGYVGYQMRFHPCLKAAHHWLQNKTIGPVISIQAEVGEYLPGWHTYEDYRQMYAARKDLGGGVILSQIHEMDYLYWFFGLPSRIFTLGGHLSNLELDVEDVASTLLEFELNGKMVPCSLNQDYLQRPPARSLLVIGNSGKILVDFVALSARCYDQQGQLVEEANCANFQRNQLFLDEISHFLACVRGAEKPLISIEDGLQSLRMALAAKESMESRKVVTLS
jgi:predicted dehydrogenase